MSRVAARVQGLSHGNDLMFAEDIMGDIKADADAQMPQFELIESFDADLRGLPAPVQCLPTTTTDSTALITYRVACNSTSLGWPAGRS